MASGKLTVLLSAPNMIPAFDRYRPLFERARIEVVVAHVLERLSEEELGPYAGKIDGIICGDDRFTPRVLRAFAPRLKVISKWGTGIDSIDRDEASRLGIDVCNTPDAFTDAVADSVMGYVLAFVRRGPWMDKVMKSGQWEKVPGRALHECTLGVIGVGRIGRAVFRRAKPFGPRLLGNDIIPVDSQFLHEVGIEMMTLHDLLANSDFISLNCDLNPTSHHLVNRETLGSVRHGAVLINTARGPVLEEQAFVEALRTGRLSGAALDVFEEEPLPSDSPLRAMENVLLAPHNANSSPSAWERVHRNTVKNLFLGLGVEVPLTLA